MSINSNPAPYHMQQALDYLKGAPARFTESALKHAEVHAILAVADAIERQTRTTIAIDDENRRERR